jgi:hypothetical protein
LTLEANVCGGVAAKGLVGCGAAALAAALLVFQRLAYLLRRLELLSSSVLRSSAAADLTTTALSGPNVDLSICMELRLGMLSSEFVAWLSTAREARTAPT